MTPIQVLMKEHENIKLLLRIVDVVCGKLESGEQVPGSHLEQIVEFIRSYADKYHHGKEEDLLFPAMAEAGIPREGGPIGAMLAEHVRGRGFVGGMAEAARKYKGGDRKAAGPVAINARSYHNLLTQHIDKEDLILFPMANAHISPDRQAELSTAFNRVEQEGVVGPAKRDELLQTLGELRAVYLD